MRKMFLFACALAVVAACGCAITNYPVIFDSRGADGGAVMQSFYDKAVILDTSQVATIWPDGSDELFSMVTQDWKGDQWLYTFDNYDPTASVMLRDMTYCDPTRQNDCWIVRSWNPDLPDAYPHGDQGAGYDNVDDPFDYEADTSCSGWRSLSMLSSMTDRIRECGSGIWADKQGAAYEFSLLDTVSFRGRDFYHLPIDSSVATFAVAGADGATAEMPVYGRFNGYVDEKLRLVVPVTPNAKYQLRWVENWVAQHGHAIDVAATYGSLNATFRVDVTTVQNALNRM